MQDEWRTESHAAHRDAVAAWLRTWSHEELVRFLMAEAWDIVSEFHDDLVESDDDLVAAMYGDE